MANKMYGKAKEKFLSGAIDFMTHNIKVLAVDGADYTPNLDTHEFHSDIPGAAIVATSPNLTGKSVTLGVADADNVTFTSVTGDPFEYLVIYRDTGTSATSPLIVLIDTAGGLPYTPFGANIIISWDNSANRIFRLGDC